VKTIMEHKLTLLESQLQELKVCMYMHLKRNSVWQVFHHYTDSRAMCTQERWHSSNRTVPARDLGDYAVWPTNTKGTVAKLGGKTKITVDLLGRKKGAIEIPRTIIHVDILNKRRNGSHCPLSSTVPEIHQEIISKVGGEVKITVRFF